MKVSALGVEEQRVNVHHRLRRSRRRRRALGDGYRVEVRIVIVARGLDASRCRVGSLFRRGDEWAVFVVDDGRARLQPVQLGQRNDREGAGSARVCRKGRLIALHPPDTLQDGARIKLRGKAP